jgi:hypothetical protein
VDVDSLLPGVNAYGIVGGDPVKLNFARNAVDFVHTKVCAETPSGVATEKGGGYQTERWAQLLTEYIDRLTDGCRLEDLLPEAALTVLRTGTAVSHARRRRLPRHLRAHHAGVSWTPDPAATERGVDIVDVKPGSNMRLLASRTGVSCGTVAAAAVNLRTPYKRSPSYTTPPR